MLNQRTCRKTLATLQVPDNPTWGKRAGVPSKLYANQSSESSGKQLAAAPAIAAAATASIEHPREEKEDQ
jgi:hypothetical protein